MVLLLAKTHGRNSVSISSSTEGLHGRVWLYRVNGEGDARGAATVSCQGKKTPAGVSGAVERFTFRIKPNARQEIWRYGGDTCTISVSLKGHGALNVALRGY